MVQAHTYSGATIILASMHGKERAIAPPFTNRLSAKVIAAENLDTDLLGTFTGETPRRGDMEATALLKACLGMQNAGARLGLASEGAFGPHPLFPFIPGGVELLTFVDVARDLVISERRISDTTNFAHLVLSATDALEPFLKRVGFPAHALIVSPNATASPVFWKGIQSRHVLQRAIAESEARSDDGQALLQTDMRAHYNPTRMTEIGLLADKLALRLACLCPVCAAPGFGVTAAERGLPCEACGAATDWVRRQVLSCSACEHRDYRTRDDGLQSVEPSHCPLCNP